MKKSEIRMRKEKKVIPNKSRETETRKKTKKTTIKKKKKKETLKRRRTTFPRRTRTVIHLINRREKECVI